MFYVVFQSEFVCRLRFCELRFKRLPCGGASDGQDSVHTSFQSTIFVYMYNIYIFINNFVYNIVIYIIIINIILIIIIILPEETKETMVKNLRGRHKTEKNKKGGLEK